MPMDAIWWLIAAIGFLMLEAATFNLVSVWFAVGSAAALLSCLATDSLKIQAVVFIAVSAFCLVAFKPLAAKLRHTSTPTNGDRNIGRTAEVLLYNLTFDKESAANNYYRVNYFTDGADFENGENAQRFCEDKLEQIPEKWTAAYEEAKRHGDISRMVMESIKLDTARKIRETLAREVEQ